MQTTTDQTDTGELLNERLVRVGSFWHRNQADLVVARLAMVGIDASLEAAEFVHINWILANAVGGVKICTLQRDADIARAIVESLEQPVTNHKTTACVQCGEHLPDDWEVCWKCSRHEPADLVPPLAADGAAKYNPQIAAIFAVLVLLFVFRVFGPWHLFAAFILLCTLRWAWNWHPTGDISSADTEAFLDDSSDEDAQTSAVLDLNERAWRATVYSWFSLMFSVPAIILLIATEEHASLLRGWPKWRRRICWVSMLFPLIVWLILLVEMRTSVANGLAILVYNGFYNSEQLVGRNE